MESLLWDGKNNRPFSKPPISRFWVPLGRKLIFTLVLYYSK